MKSLIHQLRLRSSGGILPIRNLRTLAEFAMANGTETLCMQTRQDVLVHPVDPASLKHFPGLSDMVDIEALGQHPVHFTITTSRPARHLSKHIDWLDDSAFQEVLDYFTVPPTIRVALSDPTQNIVPVFSGDVIFLATEVRGYWQIVLQKNQEPLYFSQEAVPSESIPEIVQFLELCMSTAPDAQLEEMLESLRYQFNDEMIRIDPALTLMSDDRLDFLGFQPSMESGKYNLGIHCPYGEYPPAFIQEICVLARKQTIKKIALSPTGAVIIPFIKPTDTSAWRRLLGRYGIPIHPEGYAPYTLCADNPISRNVTRKIHSELAQRNIPASGLSLSIDSDTKDGEASISISRTLEPKGLSRFLNTRYTLRYYEDFDPLRGAHITASSGLSFTELMTSLYGLIDNYHRHETLEIPQRDTQEASSKHSGNTHTCSDCLTHYDPQFGDPRAGISPDTVFDQLPDSWKCPVCEGQKALFELC